MAFLLAFLFIISAGISAYVIRENEITNEITIYFLKMSKKKEEIKYAAIKKGILLAIFVVSLIGAVLSALSPLLSLL